MTVEKKQSLAVTQKVVYSSAVVRCYNQQMVNNYHVDNKNIHTAQKRAIHANEYINWNWSCHVSG